MKSTKWKTAALALGRLTATVALTLLIYTLCLPICREPDGSLNAFLMAVLVGIPFGIRHMVLLLPPAGYDIGGSVGMIALDFILGGIIGFFALCILIVKQLAAVFAAVAGC
jgi:hypothetical protein